MLAIVWFLIGDDANKLYHDQQNVHGYLGLCGEITKDPPT
jgi:hypothetical protein